MSTPDGVEPSSFRDPSGSVFYRDDRVLRWLDEKGAADWASLANTRFFGEMVDGGRIIGTQEVALTAGETALPAGGNAVAVLEHDRIPFISYPYEWTFGMLRSAAILHLEILLAALDEGLTTKDGYAFNIQFRGSAPVFIDIGSFEPVGAGGPWVGYRQFCQTMLYPLMLEAYLAVPFQGILRGGLEGIDTADIRRLLGPTTYLRKGVLNHVVIHDALSAMLNTDSQGTRKQLTTDGADTGIAKVAATKLLALVRSLKSPRSDSVWSSYRNTCSYTDADTAAKTEFIESAVAGERRALVFDLGCNDGVFSKLVSDHADQIVSVDFDPLVVDNFFRELRRSGVPSNVLPLVQDLTDPSPARGWRGRERKAFFDRAEPDLILALALVHHLSIGANVPLPEVVDFLASNCKELIVEFVEPHDPMAKQLLANKPPGTHDDYRTDNFEKILEERCQVVSTQILPGESRRIYHAIPRS